MADLAIHSSLLQYAIGGQLSAVLINPGVVMIVKKLTLDIGARSLTIDDNLRRWTMRQLSNTPTQPCEGIHKLNGRKIKACAFKRSCLWGGSRFRFQPFGHRDATLCAHL